MGLSRHQDHPLPRTPVLRSFASGPALVYDFAGAAFE
jgi:hypothetical protein